MRKDSSLSIGDYCGQPYTARGDVWQCFMPADHPLDCERLNRRRHDIAVAHVEAAEAEFGRWYETLMSAAQLGVVLSESDEAFALWQARIKAGMVEPQPEYLECPHGLPLRYALNCSACIGDMQEGNDEPVTHPCGVCGLALNAEADPFHDCVADQQEQNPTSPAIPVLQEDHIPGRSDPGRKRGTW